MNLSRFFPRRAAEALPADTWRTSTLMVAAMLLLVVIGTLTGAYRGTENRLTELTFALFGKEASGQVHIVEMDAASMAAIRRWPWPRDHYARAVAALDAAGVRSIAFDVDMSSRGDPAGDASLAAAIMAARAPVALPTFAQNAGARDTRQLDSLPIPELREGAHLASVLVNQDPDGLLRRVPFGTVTNATARPSLSAFVAGQSGAAEESFPVDFSINPATIPRHSFIAIERGMIRPGSLAGKDVIIGATAVELGDRYNVPIYGVIHGVIIQALAAETLRGGAPMYGSWPLPLVIAAVAAFAVLAAQRRRAVAFRAGGAAALLLAGWVGARIAGNAWFEIVPALALIAIAFTLRHIVLTQRFASERRRIDPESGLPNRICLADRPLAANDSFLVAAQIDEFDALKLAVASDSIGTLLARIAERLRVASGVETVYRWEERTLLWLSPLPLDEIEAQLAGLRALMRSPFEIAGRRVGISLTFGVAACDIAEPAAHAVHAASQARRAGKYWRLHTAAESETVTRQIALLGELEGALRSGNIAVLYQPKLKLETGKIDSVEALVRWNHPERGMLPPDGFIPLFEERGRLDDLTLAVLSKALADMRGWAETGLAIGVAVNISAGLLTSESFADRALALFARTGAPPDLVTFEVTESAQFEDTDAAIATLRRFRAAGIRIAMDDYGTGQSALNYLKLLPLSELKIDRMFVAQAHVDKGDAMLVRSTVQLAHELGLSVVAEGVEEEACLDFLRQIGCDYAQGYLIGRPLSAADLAKRAAVTSPEKPASARPQAARAA